jgi:hypothetical protein
LIKAGRLTHNFGKMKQGKGDEGNRICQVSRKFAVSPKYLSDFESIRGKEDKWNFTSGSQNGWA